MPTIEYVYKNGAPKDESEIEDIVENDTKSEKVDEEKAKKEAEEKAILEKEAEEKKKLEEERLKKEAEEKERLEKERLEKERLEKEAEEKARKEAEEKKRLEEEKAKKEAEEKERIEKERLEKEAAEERARKEAAEKERLAKEAEEKAKKEAEERARKEAAEKERLAKEAEEKAKKEAEEKARKEAEEKERLAKEAEEKARLEAEERAKKEAEEKAKKEAEERARKEAEEKERLAKEAEEQAKKEAEEKAKREAEEQAKNAAEEKPAKPSALERLLQSTPTMTIEPAQPAVDEEYEEPIISPSERMLCSGVLAGSVTECALVHDTPTYTCTFTRDFASRQHNPPNQKEQWTSAIPYSRFRALHNYYHHVYPAVSFPKLPSPVKKANKKQLDVATADMNNYLQGVLNLRNSGRIDAPFANEQVPAEDALLRDVLQMVMRGYGIHNPLGQKEGGVRVKLVLDNEAPFGFLKDEDRIALQNDCCADCGARIGGKRSGGDGV